jgi:hypothetical protein
MTALEQWSVILVIGGMSVAYAGSAWRPGGEAAPWTPIVMDVSRYGGSTVPGSMSGENLTYTDSMVEPLIYAPPSRIIPQPPMPRHETSRAKLDRAMKETKAIQRELKRMNRKPRGRVLSCNAMHATWCRTRQVPAMQSRWPSPHSRARRRSCRPA